MVAAPLEDQDYPDGFKRTALFTHLLYLARDFDRIASRFSRGQKSNIKQARKKGVTVRMAGAAE